MSATLLDWPLASADGLPLSSNDCLLLLDSDFLEINEDLFKTFPSPTKLEDVSGLLDDGSNSLYPASPTSPPDTKPSRAQLAGDILQQLDNDSKQEIIFCNWPEEKVDLPIFESIPHGVTSLPVPTAPLAAPVYTAPAPSPTVPPVQCTDELLREFESVYGAVELTHLTPPQSPPGPATQLLLSYAQHAGTTPWQQPVASSVGVELERELAAVEELVRRSAAHLAPPATSPPGSPSSSSCSGSEEEWSRSTGTPHARSHARTHVDRRSRKKEQNKNAATRYRQKKKAEVEVLLSEESRERTRHQELDNKCADLQREIRYLKGLMRDLFKAKGLIK